MSRRAVILFASLSVAWGIPYLLIKIAVEELSPLTLVFARTALGALILLPIALAKGWVRPVLARWRELLIYTVIEITIPWLLLTRAEQHLTSSLTGLLVATVPLVAVVIAMLGKRHEPLGRAGAFGMGLGLAGVALLVGVDVSGSQWSAVAEMAVVAVCYAVGASLLARWFSDVPGPGVVALSLTAAAVGYLPFAAPGLPTQLPSARVIASVVLLAVVCTVGAFLLLVALIGEIGPVRATTITYVNPAVAVVAGAIVLDEPVTVWTLLGFVAVIAGSALVNRRRPAAETLDDAAPCPAPVNAPA